MHDHAAILILLVVSHHTWQMFTMFANLLVKFRSLKSNMFFMTSPFLEDFSHDETSTISHPVELLLVHTSAMFLWFPGVVFVSHCETTKKRESLASLLSSRRSRSSRNSTAFGGSWHRRWKILQVFWAMTWWMLLVWRARPFGVGESGDVFCSKRRGGCGHLWSFLPFSDLYFQNFCDVQSCFSCA